MQNVFEINGCHKKAYCNNFFAQNLVLQPICSRTKFLPPGGTPLYKLDRCVECQKVWFLSHFSLTRVRF